MGWVRVFKKKHRETLVDPSSIIEKQEKWILESVECYIFRLCHGKGFYAFRTITYK